MPAPVPTTLNARLFVGVELVISTGGCLLAMLMFLYSVFGLKLPVTESMLVSMFVAICSILLHLILMTYRFISYLLSFLALADMMDQTRIILTSMLAPGRKHEAR
jgi:hypothetical protein